MENKIQVFSNDGAVFAVCNDGESALFKDGEQVGFVIDEHVSRRRAHEEFHGGDFSSVEAREFRGVGLCRSETDSKIDDAL